jgi:hypoxanthine-DNA glycosylase
MKISSFAPLVNQSARTLILGTMPGARSLEMQQYYAHKQNAFWKIMYALFSAAPVSDRFSEKVQLLTDNHIALWDVLDNCERAGSLDSNIKNHIENDIPGLLHDFPNIKKIIFNGQQSHKFFVKKFGYIEGIRYEVVPSTSPAHTMKFEDKLKAWQNALAD